MKNLVFALFLVLGTGLNAQLNYKTAIGLRGGETSGLTIKQGIGGASAIEGIIGFQGHGLSLTVLYEKYQGTGLAGLNWYFGGGAHATFFKYYYSRKHYFRDDHYHSNYYYDGGFGIGLDGVIGLEYKIPKAPIAFSLDLKPYVEINSHGNLWTSLDPGLGIKVAF
ncbi:MAG: hypothetical protein V4638_11455 [Bacteroidota bacterium]